MESTGLLLESNLLAARLQMALTLGFHIVFASLGVGLPLLLSVAEWRYLRTGDRVWRQIARRWASCFAVLFAVGAVSGTVLSFELGILWPRFMGTFGSVIGLPFTLEGFAFFVEAIFLGIYLYGWDRLSARAHWLCGLPVLVAGVASAWFVVTANAWMNSPQGFDLVAGSVTRADPWEAMLNPATGAQTVHMILAAYLVTGLLVASAYAAARLSGKTHRYYTEAMKLGLALAAVTAPAQIVVGHWSAGMVAATQPVKLAAMEGQFNTQAQAPLRIGGLPDEETMTTPGAIELPGLLSWLAYGDRAAEVKGLAEFPRENWPPVAVVHVAFQIMVVLGVLFAAVTLVSALYWLRRRRPPEGRAFGWLMVALGPLSVVALEAGWVVTEVGRQPWIVQNVMRTREAVTSAPGIWWLFGVTLLVYFTLALGTIVVLRLLARRPLDES